jgi:hypothetical protein
MDVIRRKRDSVSRSFQDLSAFVSFSSRVGSWAIWERIIIKRLRRLTRSVLCAVDECLGAFRRDLVARCAEHHSHFAQSAD